MRRIPRPLARAPIGIFRAGFGWLFRGLLVMVERYRREKPSRMRALGRTLEIPVLLRPGPFPEDIGETLPLVRIMRTPA